MARRIGQTMVLAYAIVGAATIALEWALGGSAWSRLLPAPAGSLAVDVALGVSVGLALVAASQAAALRIDSFSRMSEGLAEVVRAFLKPNEVFLQAFMSATVEELLFRGFLQPRLGLVAASVLFGLAHLTRDRRLWIWPALSFLLGLGFGALYDARGSLVAPIVAHFIINYFNLHHLLAPREPAQPAE
ncbi:MAG: CPBP family intramembrane glutamic endopeptidase [Bradymonadia bacterium]